MMILNRKFLISGNFESLTPETKPCRCSSEAASRVIRRNIMRINFKKPRIQKEIDFDRDFS